MQHVLKIDCPPDNLQVGITNPDPRQHSPLYTSVGGYVIPAGIAGIRAPQGCETVGCKLPKSNTCSATSLPSMASGFQQSLPE